MVENKGDRILNIKTALLSSCKPQIQPFRVSTISKCTLLIAVSENFLTKMTQSILTLLLKARRPDNLWEACQKCKLTGSLPQTYRIRQALGVNLREGRLFPRVVF